MNDNDLERRLRSESGPREQGYLPSQLPAELEQPARTSRRAMGRGAALLGAGIAGLAAVALAAVASGLVSGPPNIGAESSTPSASPSFTDRVPSPTTAATVSPEPSAVASRLCRSAEIGMDIESWDGAAGSRGTVVTVYGDNCQVQQPFDVAIQTDTGDVLASGRSPEEVTQGIFLDAEQGHRIGVHWSNFCGDVDFGQVAVVFSFPGTEGLLMVAPEVTAGQLPPCMEPNAPPSVSATDIQPVQ
jgi:hypothetical protein